MSSINQWLDKYRSNASGIQSKKKKTIFSNEYIIGNNEWIL